VGDIGDNLLDPANQPVHTCVITCIGAEGAARVVATGLSFPNGMAITPDDRTLIVAEPMGHRLTAFEILADGALTSRRVYAELPDDVSPDGIALDCEGGVWIANPEGRFAVLRVLEGGEITDALELDTDGYAVMLGGPERRHLLICATATHDPAKIAQSPSATLRVLEVPVAGAVEIGISWPPCHVMPEIELGHVMAETVQLGRQQEDCFRRPEAAVQ
jgi:sugar lactone lactonase YvrE